MPTSSSHLWRRDLAALLRLTGPVAAARLGIMAMGLTDALVVGRYSAEQLGYLALGWTLPGVIMVGAMGFLSGVQVMTSRYIGQGRPELTGGVFRRGLGYALGMGVLAGAVIWLTGPAVLTTFNLAPGLAEGSAASLRVFASSLPMVLTATCAATYLESIGRAKVSMAVMWIANLVNLALDLWLVPGGFGVAALGAAGSAWATFGARTFMAAVMVAWIFRMPDAKALGLDRPASDGPAAAREQRRLGYGAGASQLVEAGAFSGMNVIAGWVSALTVAGWAVVLNLSAIVFMAPLGLAVATAVLVGRAYGARDGEGVKRAAVLGFLTASAYGVIVSLAVYLFRHQIAAAYSPDLLLMAATAPALALAGLFFWPDAIQVVAAQSLRARADVLAPTLTHIASYAVVMLPLGWLLANRLHMGLTGIMLAVIAASWMSALLLIGRFWLLERRGD